MSATDLTTYHCFYGGDEPVGGIVRDAAGDTLDLTDAEVEFIVQKNWRDGVVLLNLSVSGGGLSGDASGNWSGVISGSQWNALPPGIYVFTVWVTPDGGTRTAAARGGMIVNATAGA